MISKLKFDWPLQKTILSSLQNSTSRTVIIFQSYFIKSWAFCLALPTLICVGPKTKSHFQGISLILLLITIMALLL